MSDHVVEFIKRVGENDKMRVLSSNLSRFRNEFNKFSNTGTRMLDCIYDMALESLKIAFWEQKCQDFATCFATL